MSMSFSANTDTVMAVGSFHLICHVDQRNVWIQKVLFLRVHSQQTAALLTIFFDLNFAVPLFLALAREDDLPILNPVYKALIG